MFRSLRARLLVWFTTILIATMTAFGAVVCLGTWRARVAEVDAVLAARAATLVDALQPVAGGAFDLALPREPQGAPRLYHAIWSASGAAIDRSDAELDGRTAPPPGAATRAGRRELTRRAGSGAFVLVGRDLADVRRDVWTLAGSVASVGVVAVLLAAAGGWWLAARALRPIDRISDTARAMIGGDFAARVPVDRVATELAELAAALNEAFDRLHASLERQRRFTADASHELRTPLTTLSAELQWAQMKPRTADEYRRSIATSLKSAARMQAIIERLLSLARAGAVRQDPDSDVPLDDVTREVIRDLEPIAARRQVTIEATLDHATIRGSRDRLREAIANVVSNAIQYNIEGGRVTIAERRSGDRVTLSVTDTGIGIAADDLPRVFDPFFRADPARSRDAGGAGLGLALTDAIVRQLGGRTSCRSELGRGTTVEIDLPARMV
jgi:two-component system, OmpR family, sensor kinase